jgi:ABC-2 type transport system permease protein
MSLIDFHVHIDYYEDFYEKFVSKQQSGVAVTSLDDYENAAFTRIYIDNYFKSIRILSIGAAGKREIFDQLLDSYNKESIPITQEAAKFINKKEIADQNGFIISIGFYLMIIFGLCFFLSFLVLDDQLSGVFSRIQITPVKPTQYIIGSSVLGFLIYLILIVIYCGYIYIADIHIGVPITKLLILMILFSSFTICFSFVVAFMAKSKNAITSIVAGFATIGCALGGAYFPVDKAPELFQKMARIMPQFWFMDALYKLQADAAAKVYPNFIILGLFTILSLLIGAVLFSKNYRKS